MKALVKVGCTPFEKFAHHNHSYGAKLFNEHRKLSFILVVQMLACVYSDSCSMAMHFYSQSLEISLCEYNL